MNLKSHFFFFTCLWLPVFSQSNENEKTSIEEMSKKRQDPVSGLRSVFLQEVLLPVADGTASSFSIHPVYPFKLGSNLKLITYTIIPFHSVPPLIQGVRMKEEWEIYCSMAIFQAFRKKASSVGVLDLQCRSLREQILPWEATN